MTTVSYSIVIPARFNSSRFPGKPLAKIAGKPMLAHVYERACQTSADHVIVATDDKRIADFCQQQGFACCMTSDRHPSGTDRIAEVIQKQDWSNDRIVVGLQGDEPAIPATVLDQVAQNCAANPNADIATLCTPVRCAEEYRDPDRVKVVFDSANFALYFSRAAIPYRRESESTSEFPDAYIHIGLYAYRCRFLRAYQNMEQHILEREERLEQLRALAHGYRIHVGLVQAIPAHGVDRPDDIPKMEKLLCSG